MSFLEGLPTIYIEKQNYSDSHSKNAIFTHESVQHGLKLVRGIGKNKRASDANSKFMNSR